MITFTNTKFCQITLHTKRFITHARTRTHTHTHPFNSLFPELPRMPFLPPNQQRQSTEGTILKDLIIKEKWFFIPASQ